MSDDLGYATGRTDDETRPRRAFAGSRHPDAGRPFGIWRVFARNLAAVLPEEIHGAIAKLKKKKKKKKLRSAYHCIANTSGYAVRLAKKVHDTEASKVADYNILRAKPKMMTELMKQQSRAGNPAEREGRAEAVAVKHLAHKRSKE